MALIIAGERSGVGKTTVTLALLSYLSRQSNRVQSFKVGPDYIDPMFHAAVTGLPCRNLDPFLTSPNYVSFCFARHAKNADYALIEGVMGLFDGIRGGDGKANFASTAYIAKLLNIPLLLVIDCSRLSGSVAAIAHGYCSFDPEVKIAGVVLNRVGSKRHRELLQDALLALGLPIFGILNRQDQIAIPDRHLGLIPSTEHKQLHQLFERLAELAKNSFNWEQLLPHLQAPSIPISPDSAYYFPHSPMPKAKIALAQDSAFNFYYQDNLDLLQQLGADLIPWSPLKDDNLPPGIQGLYFGGGFPEVFAQQLSANETARQAVFQAIQAGLPTYAECGGLMYLCMAIVDFAGTQWPMVGTLPTMAIMGRNLTLGYRQAQVIGNSFLLNPGDVVWGHEFHRSQLSTNSPLPVFLAKGQGVNRPLVGEGWYTDSFHASYIHLHFGELSWLAQRFISACCANVNFS